MFLFFELLIGPLSDRLSQKDGDPARPAGLGPGRPALAVFLRKRMILLQIRQRHRRRSTTRSPQAVLSWVHRVPADSRASPQLRTGQRVVSGSSPDRVKHSGEGNHVPQRPEC